ncbi:MAG: cadmium-translocating P-type ATPase [Alphaproteobacteria bacterium]|nr:MAG: cadmium-translocating P-type ATPase [Alphaproteobacteria bacterium]
MATTETATTDMVSDATPSFRVRISGMDCADCARTLERGVNQLDDVECVQVNFTTEIMHGRGTASLDVIAAKIRDLGYAIADDSELPEVSLPEARGVKGFVRYFVSHTRNAIALGGVALLLAAFALSFVSSAARSGQVVDLLFLVVTVVIAYPLAQKGLRALVQTGRITIDLLVTIAVVGAVFIGATGEAATVAFLFTLGEALEGYSAERSRQSLRSLMAIQPKEATVIRFHDTAHDDHGGDAYLHHYVVPVESIQVGETVFVRPGEQIPIDGKITQGASSINQAPVTGESVPVDRGIGDDVFSGTINGEGALEIEVTRLASNSTISQIARLVEQAQAQRSPAERFIDRFAAWYTPSVVGLAIVMLLVATVIFGQPVFETENSHGWLYRALALLIVACPCALVISIPVTVVSSLTRLAQLGVLVKGGEQLIELSEAKVFAFDKTGTLTMGRPVVTGMKTADCQHDEAVDPDCPDCNEMLEVAVSVESGSEHPFAHAVLREARRRDMIGGHKVASAITAIKGGGVSGKLNGETIIVGRQGLFEGALPLVSLDAETHSTMFVARDNKMLGGMSVEDVPREESSEVLRQLRAIDPHTYIVMLTGDHAKAADALAQRIGGIDEVRSELRPADKMRAVEQLRESHGRVAMIGDGINDAPALALADIGIAMGGSGTAQAMETADIVLMQDNLKLLLSAVRIGRKTRSVLRQNIALSLGLKIAFLFLAIPGLATLWMAVFADVGATLMVTLNGMRMLRENAD